MNTAFLQVGCGRPQWQTPKRFRHLLRVDPKPEKVGADSITALQDKPVVATEDTIVCRQCLHAITSNAEHKIVDGAHAHTFANPEGIVFEIVCFRDAWGCAYVGPTSPQFTWFAGYVWRIAVCANCHVHLGWRFSTPEGRFFHGLITDRLTARDG
jgi:hypothetical protein